MTAAVDVVSAGPLPPPLAARLVHAGLLPFVLGALLVWLVWPDAHPYTTLALSCYAATVIALLGGVHWGIGMRESHPEPRLFAWGVAPPLVAWLAVMMPPSSGLVIHGAMLLVCYAVDRRVYPRHGLAHWLTLRFRLSAVASLSCFLGAAGA